MLRIAGPVIGLVCLVIIPSIPYAYMIAGKCKLRKKDADRRCCHRTSWPGRYRRSVYWGVLPGHERRKRKRQGTYVSANEEILILI